MATRFRVNRRVSGAAGAPASLLSGEIAYNMVSGILYIGYGDDGSGNATSVKAFAEDDYSGGGSTYSASGNGIELLGSEFQLNYSEIATGISLSSYLTTASAASSYQPLNGGLSSIAGLAGTTGILTKTGANTYTLDTTTYATTTALALKANIASPTFTGTVTTAASAAGGAGLRIPHGAAPTSPTDGDIWTTTGGVFTRSNGATKTIAFTDSALTGNTTGSAATLTTSRAIGITGGGITGAGVNFNGSAAINISASVDAGHITLARMANLAANSIIGNNTGSPATPIALTVAQVKTLLSISFTDVTGTATTGQIPNLDAAKITTGTFTTTQIPNLDAAKITSGVFDIARIPVLPGSQVIVSSGAISNLTAPQQAEIDEGAIVTTTDGRRWVYSGAGSKTLEASYVELADITPEWTVIANKPSFATVATTGAYTDLSGKPSLATVATTGAYSDLTGKPTLGTMAAQDATAVAITGGTIDGVILDGGTF
jgi:hypothetical protein